jgi:hypothetical protein
VVAIDPPPRDPRTRRITIVIVGRPDPEPGPAHIDATQCSEAHLLIT